MEKIHSKREWLAILLICKDVVDVLEHIFTQCKVYFMPINGAYFLHTDKFDTLPPSQSFEIEFIVQGHQFERVVDKLEDLDNCVKKSNSPEKALFSYTIGKSEIGVAIHKTISIPGTGRYPAEEIFSRGRKNEKKFMVFPSEEDVLILFICKIFNNIGLFIDYSLSVKVKILHVRQNISSKRFWALAGEYNIKKFAVYILLLYSKKQMDKVALPERYFYSTILSWNVINNIYPLLPGMLKNVIFKVPFVHQPVLYILSRILQKIKRKCVNTAFLWYCIIIEKLAKPVIAYSEVKVLNRISRLVPVNTNEYAMSGKFTDRIIIGTTTGLWILNENGIKQIAMGPCYGISRMGSRWYVNQRLGAYSRIFSFRLDLTNEQPKMREARTEQVGLPINAHQIDSFDKVLYVTDTTNNRVQIINDQNKIKSIYPNGRINKNINNHFNSIFITKEFLFILAHNGWHRPKKNSQIYVVSRLTHKNTEIIELDAQEAHNIILYRKKWMYCDSLGGVLKWGDTCLFTDREHYLRGLAVTEDTIFVGGSEIIDRGKRAFSNSILWFLDHLGRVKTSIELERIGQILEIRAIGFDYGLSDLWKKEQ